MEGGARIIDHWRLSHRARIAAILCAAAMLLPCACVRQTPRVPAEDLSFALISGTNPESPFSAIGPRIASAFEAIRVENPVFILHLGNMVFGGRDWMGIKESDVSRQYAEFITLAARARSILYTVKGSGDEYNGSAELYERYTGKRRYYSFNYGNIHFIVLDTSDPGPGIIGDAQLRWLDSDLDAYRHSPAIFVCTHHPLFLPRYARTSGPDDMCKMPERLHERLRQYPVKAVFSGRLAAYYSERKDNILYVTAGCGGFNKSDAYSRANQFYMVRFIGGALSIAEKKAGH